jgi:hypothetical protein
MEAVGPLRVRTGLHTGEADLRGTDAAAKLATIEAQAGLARLREFTLTPLASLVVRASAAGTPLLQALAVLQRLNQAHRRSAPADAPVRYVRARWRPYVLAADGGSQPPLGARQGTPQTARTCATRIDLHDRFLCGLPRRANHCDAAEEHA